MVERAGGTRLLLESAQTLFVYRESMRQHLDGDLTPKARVAGAIDLAHPAGTERCQDLIWAKTGSGRQTHAVRLCTTA
jgi:hypothetical protein